MADNGVIFQSFEWEMPDDGKFYKRLEAQAKDLVEIGFDAIWFPPAFKATGTNDVGYGVYDLYDLGEFDQKGSVRTKYGTKEELLSCIKAVHENKMQVYLDVVMNHKAGADYSEEFYATQVDPDNRLKEISDSHLIEGWTGFNFPGRNGKYSDFTWNYNHFSGVDYDNKTGTKGVFRIDGFNKGWAYGVSGEKGNYDYLMFSDIDHYNAEVQEELLKWSQWLIDETNCDGFRIDAAKHIDDKFMRMFTEDVFSRNDDFYIFGEFWDPSMETVEKYLEDLNYNIDIFDVPLHYNLYAASKDDDYDLRTIFDNTVVAEFPEQAVTFVDNHDSQPGQALESFINRGFKERAYALILLRKDGYPCVFAGDYYGIKGGPEPQESLEYDIKRLLEVRANFAYGEERNFFQEQQAIGWARLGTEEHQSLLAVTMSMHSQADIEMDFGKENAGRTFKDYLNRNGDYEVTLDENGKGRFPVKGGSLSCWVTDLAEDFYDEDTKPKDIDERE